ncbi:MAG: GDP-mannose 4,6-dehydratase, partial [Candidatus Omnitrophota bacterium]
MKVLITGITGFVGSHLAEYLLFEKRLEVHGIERWRSKEDNVASIKEKIRLHYCDIRDASSVHDVIRKMKPDRIFHLAAQSFVPTSWTAPAETLT